VAAHLINRTHHQSTHCKGYPRRGEEAGSCEMTIHRTGAGRGCRATGTGSRRERSGCCRRRRRDGAGGGPERRASGRCGTRSPPPLCFLLENGGAPCPWERESEWGFRTLKTSGRQRSGRVRRGRECLPQQNFFNASMRAANFILLKKTVKRLLGLLNESQGKTN
jgi:hypothetical protein